MCSVNNFQTRTTLPVTLAPVRCMTSPGLTSLETGGLCLQPLPARPAPAPPHVLCSLLQTLHAPAPAALLPGCTPADRRQASPALKDGSGFQADAALSPERGRAVSTLSAVGPEASGPLSSLPTHCVHASFS